MVDFKLSIFIVDQYYTASTIFKKFMLLEFFQSCKILKFIICSYIASYINNNSIQKAPDKSEYTMKVKSFLASYLVSFLKAWVGTRLTSLSLKRLDASACSRLGYNASLF